MRGCRDVDDIRFAACGTSAIGIPAALGAGCRLCGIVLPVMHRMRDLDLGHTVDRAVKTGRELCGFDIDRYQQAVRNVADNNLMERILVYLCDAGTFETSEKFDLIFIDGPKAQYTKYFERFKNNLTEDGVFICDNLSFHGMVEDLSLTHNYSTIKMVKKLRKFIDFLKTNEEFETQFFELGDGISVSKRK
jgi:predicted O-methyltransferase YrrM